jgi:uncharacterized protein (DUF2336 family)
MSLLSDVHALKESALPEVRQAVAEKVTQYFNVGMFDANEEALAFDIIRLLARDVSELIRKTVAENLKSNSKIPHDVALCLAQDVIDVALPILEFSTVLTDGDLLEIIRSAREVAKLMAITKRNGISESVSSALILNRNEPVVVSLFGNKTANISEESLRLVLKEFAEKGNVIESLIDRGDLPIGIVEKMINTLSQDFRERLIAEYKVPTIQANDLVTASQEQATLSLLNGFAKVAKREIDTGEGIYSKSAAEAALIKKVEQLVRHLHQSDRLTESIVLRSLCEGNIRFFEVSLAILAGVPIMNARTLIRDKNPSALNSLFKRAKFPASIFEAVHIIVQFSTDEEVEGVFDTTGFKDRLIEHILSNEYNKTIPLMPYVMAIIGSKIKARDVVGGTE